MGMTSNTWGRGVGTTDIPLYHSRGIPILLIADCRTSRQGSKNGRHCTILATDLLHLF